MRKLMMLSMLVLGMMQPVFADNQVAPDEANNPSCETIANACTNAGFMRNGEQGKIFWHDCMKPILFGQQVADVTVNAKDVKECRTFKIKNMQQQLDQLKAYHSKQ